MSKYEGAEAIKNAKSYRGRFRAFLTALRKCPIERTTGVDIIGDRENPDKVCAIGYAMVLLDIPGNYDDPWREVAHYFGLSDPGKIYRINDRVPRQENWRKVAKALEENTLQFVSDRPLTTS